MTIETERLILRPFTEADAEDVFEYLHEPAVNCFACMKLESLEATRKELKQRQGDELYLAITLKGNGKVIGEIFAHPEGNDPEDEKTRFDELLTAYIEKPQGKPTLVPESDKRPAMNTAKKDFMEDFDND